MHWTFRKHMENVLLEGRWIAEMILRNKDRKFLQALYLRNGCARGQLSLRRRLKVIEGRRLLQVGLK